MFKISMVLIFANFIFISLNCSNSSGPSSSVTSSAVDAKSRITRSKDFVVKTAIASPKTTSASIALLIASVSGGCVLRRAEADSRMTIALAAAAVGAGVGFATWTILDTHNRTARWQSVEVGLSANEAAIRQTGRVIKAERARVEGLTVDLRSANVTIASNTTVIGASNESLGRTTSSLEALAKTAADNQAEIGEKFVSHKAKIASETGTLEASCTGVMGSESRRVAAVEAKFTAAQAQQASNLAELKELSALIGQISPASRDMRERS